MHAHGPQQCRLAPSFQYRQAQGIGHTDEGDEHGNTQQSRHDDEQGLEDQLDDAADEGTAANIHVLRIDVRRRGDHHRQHRGQIAPVLEVDPGSLVAHGRNDLIHVLFGDQDVVVGESVDLLDLERHLSLGRREVHRLR